MGENQCEKSNNNTPLLSGLSNPASKYNTPNFLTLNCLIVLGPHRFNGLLKKNPKVLWKCHNCVFGLKIDLRLKIFENLACCGYYKKPLFDKNMKCFEFAYWCQLCLHAM